MKIIDISVPITTTMPVWPGDPSIDLVQISSITSGDSANVTRITMSVHTGTHIDAPKHFIESGITIDQIPLDRLMGEVLVIEIDPQVNVISETVLKAHPNIDQLLTTKKVLFHTRNSNLWEQFPDSFEQNFVGIDTSGAHYLQQFNLDLVGIDYLSIAPYDDTELPHQILLSGGSILLEGLDLSDAPGGIYELFCLPLNILGCEGSPARVFLLGDQ
jgi:arylformamidase